MNITFTPEFIEDLERLIPDQKERQEFVDTLVRKFESGEIHAESQSLTQEEMDMLSERVLTKPTLN